MKNLNFLILFLLAVNHCRCFSASLDYLLPPHMTTPEIENSTTAGVLPSEFTMIFWNLQWFPGRESTPASSEKERKHIETVRDYLKQFNPDLVFASEIRNLKEWKRLDLGYDHLACTNIPRTEKENRHLSQQGIALTARFPWVTSWVIDFSQLPDTPDRPSRGILAAEFKLQDGKSLFCYAFHLKSNRGGLEQSHLKRERAIDYLIADWKNKGINPEKDSIVVLGDANTSLTHPLFREEKTLRKLVDLGFLHQASHAEKPIDTYFPDSGDSADIDYILISPALQKIAQIEMKVLPSRLACSDHAPLWLRIHWK
ncbi:MAG: endonuclease/exonuclease/phosphatase family protein [Verrucomicrobiota bacterium]